MLKSFNTKAKPDSLKKTNGKQNNDLLTPGHANDYIITILLLSMYTPPTWESVADFLGTYFLVNQISASFFFFL